MNKLDIDYVISQKELSDLNLSLIDSDFFTDVLTLFIKTTLMRKRITHF